MSPVSGASWSATTFAFALDVAAKATVILIIVLVIQKLMRRRRAFLGSAVVNAGLVGLLLLPVAALTFPAVSIAWLPARVGVSRLDVGAVSDAPSAATWRAIRLRMSYRLAANPMTLRKYLIPQAKTSARPMTLVESRRPRR